MGGEALKSVCHRLHTVAWSPALMTRAEKNALYRCNPCIDVLHIQNILEADVVQLDLRLTLKSHTGSNVVGWLLNHW